MLTSDGEFIEYTDELRVEGFALADGVDEGDIDDFVVAYAYHDVALALYEGLNGCCAYSAGQNAVASRGRTAALEMAENGNTDIEVGIFLADTIGVVHGTTFGALADDDDATLLALADAALHKLYQLVATRGVLGNNGCFGSCCYGTILCEETCVAAHYFNEEDTLVGGSGVANLVNTLGDSVERGVVADGGVGAVEVVVDGAWQTDAGEVVFLSEEHGTRQRTITANDDKGIDGFALEGFVGAFAACGCFKFFATGCAQKCATRLNNIADVLGGEVFDLALDETIVATINSFYFEPVANTATGDGAYCCVHSWGIASRGQHADTSNFCHNSIIRKLISKNHELSQAIIV